MIRVAFDLRDPVRSGIARVATSTLKAFLRGAADRFEVVVAGPPGALAELKVSSWGRVSVVPFRSARYSLAAEREWPRVRSAVGDATWFFPHFDVPIRAGGERFITLVHDTMHFDGAHVTRLKGLVAKRWMGRSVARSARVHTPSRHSAERIAAFWPRVASRIRVVPNGVDELFFMPSRAPLPADVASRLAGRRYMLSVGNLKRHKNLRVGVDVLRDVPELAWIVVGEWFPEWEEVAAAARDAGVDSRMILLPRAADDTLVSLYRASACLLFPSTQEGFGLPVLEAMAAGTPVVASSATSVPEVLGDCGWLCDPHDAAQFTNAVRAAAALQGKDRDAHVERARARARAFSWERCAEALADSIESTVQTPRGATR